MKRLNTYLCSGLFAMFVGVSILSARPLKVNLPNLEKAAAAIPAEGDFVKADLRFTVVDIYVNVNDDRLAAWQIEFKAMDKGRVKIVGIEGNSSLKGFRQPPYYDAKAMQQERVVIADFSTGKNESLPTGRFKLATIHVQISGAEPVKWDAQLKVAVDRDGRAVKATVNAIEGKSP